MSRAPTLSSYLALDPDDIAYRKSVRNMAIILAAILVTIFAAIFIPPYLNPYHEVFPQSVSYDSPFGFAMNLTLNSTSVAPGGRILLTGWVNSTSDAIENDTAADSWAVPQGSLWQRECTSGWPIGIGVMQGHYTQDNYTLGTLLPLQRTSVPCPVEPGSPAYLLFYPHSSTVLASVGGSPTIWVLETDFSFGYGSLAPNAVSGSAGLDKLPAGVYTAVLADEWGDVLTTNFLVS